VCPLVIGILILLTKEGGLSILSAHFFFVPLPVDWRGYSVSAKKETSFFVLLSTFRNFAS
jgi:hypothetical protein